MQPSSNNEIANERGSIIVLVAICLVALLGVTALAMDAGQLYRLQLGLQKAADAGALAGAGYAIQVGQSDLMDAAAQSNSSVSDYLGAKIERVVRQNLLAAKIIHNYNAPLSLDATYDFDPMTSSVFDVNVDLGMPAQYLLIDRIPFHLIGADNVGQQNIAATATARRPVANVAINIDVSRSTYCPSSGSCDCLRTSSCAGRRRLDDLVDALKAFLKLFDPNSDKLAIVPYNISAQAFSLQDYAGNVNNITEPMIDLLVDRLKNEFETGSATNLCDALLTGGKFMNDWVQNEEKSYVIYSDGAPTAARALFASPSGLTTWNPDAMGQYDYSHHTMQWVYPDGTDYPGPSRLYQTGLVDLGHRDAILPPSGDGVTSPAVADCAANQAIPIPPPGQGQTIEDVLMVNAPLAFVGCVGDLGFHPPNEPTRVYSAGNSADDPKFYQWRKLYYNCAVAYSDWLRENKGTVYTVGLGEPAGPIANDPYENIDDVTSRKDVLLTRIANDYITAVEVPAQAATPWQHPEYDITGVSSLDEWNQQSNRRQGMYLATTESEDLKALFLMIARQVLMRLIK